MTIDEKHRMRDAHHEAGHVVRAVAWQYPVELSTIEYWNGVDARHGFTDHMTFHSSKWTAFDYCKAICIATAGTVAEEKFIRRGRRSSLTEEETRALAWRARGDNQDIHEFRAQISHEVPDEDVTRWQIEHVDEWVDDPEIWSSIRVVARALYRRGTLNGIAIGALLQRHHFRSRPRAFV